MPLFENFAEISINVELRKLAVNHAYKRTIGIKRQFVPANAPLEHIESNYVGALGEIAVRLYLEENPVLEDNYERHRIDDGDLKYDGLTFDVKTDAIPAFYYQKLYDGSIKNHESYGCRVFTAKHIHHLKKYTGGLIFCAFKIPNDARKNKIEVTKKKPTWYSPRDPHTGRYSKYNSLNYIFHHSELISVKKLR